MMVLAKCLSLASIKADSLSPVVLIFWRPYHLYRELTAVLRAGNSVQSVSSQDESVRCRSSVPGSISRAGRRLDLFAGSSSRLRRQSLVEGDQSWCKLLDEGNLDDAFEVLEIRSRQGHVSTDMFYRLLKVCKETRNLRVGKQVHVLAVESGYESSAFLGNHIIRMYASQGYLSEARKVFSKLQCPTVQVWTSIISAYGEHGQAQQAIQLYQQMSKTAVKPDDYIFVAVLKACASLGDLNWGKQIHVDVKNSNFETNLFVGSTLVDMYAKCGNLEEARKVFDKLPTRNQITWSAMIMGYVQHGLGQEAIQLCTSMQHHDIMMDSVTFVSILKACSSTGAIQEGKRVHSAIISRGLERDVFVGSALVDMYGKCGSLDDAKAVFDRLLVKNVVTWTALINAYGQHNHCRMALQCFEEMEKQGVKPNAATFTCLLVACSHVGLVAQGQEYFRTMVQRHGITPERDHYTCMVDLLGRAGRLNEGEEVLRSMPFEHDSVGWTSLLTSCRMHGNVTVARRCFDRLLQLQLEEPASYVLMSAVYADAGMWREADDMDRLRRELGAKKKPAMATIELNKKVYEFVVGQNRDDTSAKLRSLISLYNIGAETVHMDNTSGVEDALCGHAEKLALAYGLLNTPGGTTLLVTKNLRMCNHCHSGTKVISRMEKRDIIVRDAHRVHHFKHGVCSCDDHL